MREPMEGCADKGLLFRASKPEKHQRYASAKERREKREGTHNKIAPNPKTISTFGNANKFTCMTPGRDAIRWKTTFSRNANTKPVGPSGRVDFAGENCPKLQERGGIRPKDIRRRRILNPPSANIRGERETSRVGREEWSPYWRAGARFRRKRGRSIYQKG